MHFSDNVVFSLKKQLVFNTNLSTLFMFSFLSSLKTANDSHCILTCFKILQVYFFPVKSNLTIFDRNVSYLYNNSKINITWQTNNYINITELLLKVYLFSNSQSTNKELSVLLFHAFNTHPERILYFPLSPGLNTGVCYGGVNIRASKASTRTVHAYGASSCILQDFSQFA